MGCSRTPSIPFIQQKENFHRCDCRSIKLVRQAMDRASGHYYADAPWSFFPSAVLMCEETRKQHSSASRHCRRFICAPESAKTTR